MTPEEQKLFAEYEAKIDQEINWPPKSLLLVAAFAMLVAVGMVIQSLWLDHFQIMYPMQLLGSWVCFFLSFYAHNRYDKLMKGALGRARTIIETQIERFQAMQFALTSNEALALAVSKAEQERLNPIGELN